MHGKTLQTNRPTSKHSSIKTNTTGPTLHSSYTLFCVTTTTQKKHHFFCVKKMKSVILFVLFVALCSAEDTVKWAGTTAGALLLFSYCCCLYIQRCHVGISVVVVLFLCLYIRFSCIFSYFLI